MQLEARELGLTITRRELLETSIAQLRTLAAFLADQLSEPAQQCPCVETRVCAELLLAVKGLIQTHHTARVPPIGRCSDSV